MQVYGVYGLVRRSSSTNYDRLGPLQDQVKLIPGDLLDSSSLIGAIQIAEPDEVYNLGAQSFVPTSWNQPVLTSEFTALGVTRMLEAIRTVNAKIKFYQASSSAMFGMVDESPQRETSRFYPRSPYGVAKLYGHWMTVNYRESYGLYAVSGILFNHESDPALYRPAEVDHLRGDYSNAREVLGWRPRLAFADLVRLMVDCDLVLVAGEQTRVVEQTRPPQFSSAVIF